jgi:hypothetical protein
MGSARERLEQHPDAQLETPIGVSADPFSKRHEPFSYPVTLVCLFA